jgi:hypothetical protein
MWYIGDILGGDGPNNCSSIMLIYVARLRSFCGAYQFIIIIFMMYDMTIKYKYI